MHFFSICLLVAAVSAHPRKIHRRQQNASPVALWGVCNQPWIGIVGPLPCAGDAKCICKDDSYSQCRTPINGVWSYDPCWQCQQPGDTSHGIASGCAQGTSGGISNSTTTPTNPDTSTGSGTGGDSSTDPDSSSGTGNGGSSSSSSTGGDDISASPDTSNGSGTGDSSSSSTDGKDSSTKSTPTVNGAGDTPVQPHAAVANPPAKNLAVQVPAAPSPASSAAGGVPLSTGTAGSNTGSTVAGGSKLAAGVAGGSKLAQGVAGGSKLGAAVVGGGSSGSTGTDSTSLKTQGGDAANPYKGAKASMGKCPNVQVPEGWDGVASSSYYGYMGTACNCGKAQFGQASWQANTGESLGIGPGVYSGAVNQVLFQGALNGGGQPNCGAGCGLCYELMTTGVNAYAGGVGGGSTIQMMVVDACYGAADTAPHWCSSNTASGVDDFGCEKHFDIDTDPTLGNVPAVGQDGTTWTDGGQIVLYRLLPNCSSISPMLEEAFNTDCKPYCTK